MDTTVTRHIKFKNFEILDAELILQAEIQFHQGFSEKRWKSLG